MAKIKLSLIEHIQAKIYFIRGHRVMLDSDLAELYGVETKVLNESKQGKNIKYLPFAFTEQGVAMLSSVLRSDTAIKVNIEIMRAKFIFALFSLDS